MRKASLTILSLLGISLLLTGCTLEENFSEEELEELDTELEKLSNDDLESIVEETNEGKALVGQAPFRRYSYRTIKKRISDILKTSETIEETLCYDSDGGIDFNKQGVVRLKGQTGLKQEKCMPNGKLLEWYCVNNEAKSGYFSCSSGMVCNQGECVFPNQVFTCGDGVCENNREMNSECSYDCGWGSCKGKSQDPDKSCNEKVDVYCACQDSALKILEPSISCADCSKQEDLFDEFKDMQSQVYDCLAEYFQFNPPRVPNLVVYDSSKEPCNNQQGCFGYEGGWSSPLGVRWNPIQGSRNYGENQPTEPQQLMADKHETTHYFLNQMIHGPPGWFDEAVAIQTNERLNCHPQENPKGDSYLRERLEDSGGIIMSNSTYLNDDFYQRLKNGQTSLSVSEKTNSHVIGTLWIIGLKQDYGCTENCVRDIVLELKEYINNQCQISQDECRLVRKILINDIGEGGGSITSGAIVEPGTSPKPKPEPTRWYIWTGINMDNEIVKRKTDKVVGQDTSALFNLLEIQY